MSVRKQAAALKERRWTTAAGFSIRYATDQLVEWLCDYGESIPRVFASLLGVYVFFTLLYGLTGGLVHVDNMPGSAGRTPVHDPSEIAAFSLLAMTTATPPPDILPRNEHFYLLCGIQAFLGILLTGLLGFVLGNRIRR